MIGDRWAVIGLARPRSAWFGDLTGWANAELVPVDFLKCIGTAEVRARLAAGTPCSALVADAGAPGLDRDLVAEVQAVGGAVIVICDGSRLDGVAGLGADALLPEPLEPSRLVEVLRSHAPPLRSSASHSAAALHGPTPGAAPHGHATDDPATDEHQGWRGRLVVVTGGHGAGASSIAMALAQGFGHQPGGAGATALADLALGAHLAMYHDARDVVPGLQELVEAHRRTPPNRAALRDHLYVADGRGYDVLLGLRRPRDWTVLRTRALDATLRSLVATYRHVVVDVDADLDGEAETGSADLEDRNARGRLALARADLALVVVDASTKGLHDGVRVLRDVTEHVGDPGRVLPVVNRAPHRRRARAELARTLATLTGGALATASPVFVEIHPGLEAAHRLACPLPRTFARRVTTAATSRLAALGPRDAGSAADAVRMVPASSAVGR